MVQSQDSGPASLHEALRHLAEIPCNDQVDQFLQTWPLPTVFRELTSPHAASADVDVGCTALRKVFDLPSGSALLPEVLPYAAAALQGSAPAPLRRLAVQLTGRLAAGAAGVEDAQRSQAADLLLQAVGDEDVGVALDAEKALKQLAASPAGLAHLMQQQQRLRGMAGSADPTLRARALTLVIGVASASPQAAAAVHEAGLLQDLVAELRRADDLLSCMAALQLVEHAAQHCDPGMALQLQQELAPQLTALLQHEEPLLRCSALQAAAVLVGVALQAGPASMDAEGAGAGHPAANGGRSSGSGAGQEAANSPLAQPLLAALKAALDISSTEHVPGEVEEAALDAASTLSNHEAGAALLLQQPQSAVHDICYNALGRPPSPAVRTAALHALAAMAGAERAAGRSRAAALLPEAAEAVLRGAVYEGASAGGAAAMPAEVFLSQLQQPFLEHRVAAYRALSALLLRDWAAADVCSNASMLAFLTDSQSETSLQGCEWRYACVTALAATIKAVTGAAAGANGVSMFQSVLSAALPLVDAAARQGPFGQGQAAPAAHLVATMPGA